MTQTELLDTIRTEIERQSKSIEDATGDFAEGRRLEQRIILSFLDTVQEPEVKGLEEEIREYMSNEDNNPFDWDWRDKRDCARHFAEWGAKNAK